MSATAAIRACTVLSVVLLSRGSLAAEVRSGLPVGTSTQSIPVSDVTGPYKGERICYVCDFENAPNVLAFFREPSDDAARLIVQLNQLYLRNKDRNFKAVVMMIAGSGAKKWLEELSRSEKLEIPLTFFTKGSNDVAGRVYKLDPEVRNTFLMTVDRTVAANVSDIGPSEFSQVAHATEEMLAGTPRKP
jgi:hypothetical protein